ncbi:hypothetical protein BC828DRAFT_399136 [Blastocladiella britannica]|nr:hypothetical protein BC828DRAFT_399136 [Blastocladiella britannica]
MLNLAELPDDILVCISQYLDLKTTVRLCSTCRAIRNVTSLALGHPTLLVLVAALVGDSACLDLTHLPNNWSGSGYSTPQFGQYWEMDFSRDYTTSIAYVLVYAAEENAPEMLPLVAGHCVMGACKIDWPTFVLWQPNDSAAERVYTIYTTLERGTDQGVADARKEIFTSNNQVFNCAQTARIREWQRQGSGHVFSGRPLEELMSYVCNEHEKQGFVDLDDFLDLLDEPDNVRNSAPRTGLCDVRAQEGSANCDGLFKYMLINTIDSRQ